MITHSHSVILDVTAISCSSMASFMEAATTEIYDKSYAANPVRFDEIVIAFREKGNTEN